MVRVVLRSGRKSEGDAIVFLIANDEVLTFQQWLFIGQHYFNSEYSCFPVDDGYLGRAMLVSAVVSVACGVPLETVCRRFNLPFEQLEVEDHRLNVPRETRVLKPSENLGSIPE